MPDQYFCHGCNSLIDESPLRESNEIKCVKCMCACIEIIESNDQMREVVESARNNAPSQNRYTDPETSAPPPAPSSTNRSTTAIGRPMWMGSMGGMNSLLGIGTSSFAQILSSMRGANFTPSNMNSSATTPAASTPSGADARGMVIPHGGSATVTVLIKNSDGTHYQTTEAAAADSVGQILADQVNDTIRRVSSAHQGSVVVERSRGSNPTTAGDSPAHDRNDTGVSDYGQRNINNLPTGTSMLAQPPETPFRFRQPRRRTEAGNHAGNREADQSAPNHSIHSQFHNLFQIIQDMGSGEEINLEAMMNPQLPSEGRRRHRQQEHVHRASSSEASSEGSLYSDGEFVDDRENDNYIMFRGSGGDSFGNMMDNFTRYQFTLRHGFENADGGNGENINDFLHRVFQSHQTPTNPTPTNVIHGLPTIAGGVTKSMKETNEMYALPCSVCQDEFDEQSEPVVQLPCGHVYHRDCIVPWLERSQQCPTCRANVITGQSPR